MEKSSYRKRAEPVAIVGLDVINQFLSTVRSGQKPSEDLKDGARFGVSAGNLLVGKERNELKEAWQTFEMGRRNGTRRDKKTRKAARVGV